MGRFEDPQDALFKAINTSLGYDQRLYPEDIEGSIAHAEMLAAQHIITAADLEEIKSGLAAVRKELDAGVFPFNDDDEDIHMAIERRLTELVGDACIHPPSAGTVRLPRTPSARILLDA